MLLHLPDAPLHSCCPRVPSLRNASAFARRSSALMLSTRSISFSKRIASSPYKMGVSFQGNLYLIVICMIWFTWTKVAIPFCNSNTMLSKTALIVSGFRIDFNIFCVRRLPVGWEAVSQPGGRAAPSRLGDGLTVGWELPSHPAGRWRQRPPGRSSSSSSGLVPT